MKRLNSNTYVLWAGSEESFHAVEQAIQSLAALEAHGPEALKAKIIEVRGSSQSDDPWSLPDIHEVKDGVGILHVQGSLIPGSAGFMRLFGVIGYDDIKASANALAADSKVKSILLHVASPGGAVSGCEECSNHLASVGSVKPMITYTDTIMASGGIWLGSAGQRLMASKTAHVGSVGVIATHVEYSKMHEKNGITVSVVRAGEFKQLANANEPLSDEGKAHLKAQAEAIYDVFADGISSKLGVSRKDFDARMGRGREFLGSQAVEVGLIHEVSSFEQAFNYAKKVDRPKLSNHNSRHSQGTSSMKATLASALVLQLIAGAQPASLDLNKAEATAEGVQPDAEALTLLQAQAITVHAQAQAKVSELVAAATTPLQARVNELTAAVSTEKVQVDALKTTNTALTEKVQTLEKVQSSCEKALHSNIAAMQVALGGSDTGSGLTGAALVAEYERVETAFAAKFPTAKITVAASAETAKPVAAAKLDPWAVIALRQSQARA